MFLFFPVKVIADLGANVTLPCRLMNKGTPSFGHIGIRVKWSKVEDDEALNEDVLLSMGFHKNSYGSFEGRVFLEEQDSEDASITITDVSMDDMGTYRCEIINGMVDNVQEVVLEVLGDLTDGKSMFVLFFCLRCGPHLISYNQYQFQFQLGRQQCIFSVHLYVSKMHNSR